MVDPSSPYADLDAALAKLIELSKKAMLTASELVTLQAIGKNPEWSKLYDDLDNTPRFDPAQLLEPGMLTANCWGGSRRDPKSPAKLYRRHRRGVLKRLASGRTESDPVAAYAERLRRYNEAVDAHFRRKWAEAGR